MTRRVELKHFPEGTKEPTEAERYGKARQNGHYVHKTRFFRDSGRVSKAGGVYAYWECGNGSSGADVFGSLQGLALCPKCFATEIEENEMGNPTKMDPPIIVSVEPRKVVVTDAPEHAVISMEALLRHLDQNVSRYVHPDMIYIGAPNPVGYKLVSWDPEYGHFHIERFFDSRPKGSK